MELRHLRYFVVLAEEENFHRAAERLHVSQSPLSRQMRDLQAELGITLIEPSGRGVRLTTAGRFFAEKARRILAGVDTAVHETSLVAQGKIGTVAIGFETGRAYFDTLGTIVATFRRRRPLIALRLTPMSSAEQWEALHAGEILFGYGNYPPNDRSLHYVEVARDRLGVVLPPDHRLATRSWLKTADLRSEPVLLQPRSLYPRLYDDIIAAMRRHDIVLDVVAEVFDLEALLTLVTSGDAITFGPEKQIPLLLLGNAVWRPVVDLDVQVAEIGMWRPEDADTPLLRPLIDIVNETRVSINGGTDTTVSGG
ncbi:DNA-binding transcriptional regulator, LysR family [Sinosporangium album]|uniref:DNA-binding transcriptional regulator, LysR family n=1 Tax=Sinosporangium album TaxID=504805 RepID=A0A1G8KP16_9ACTN|nr:LysR family transcriptional regulator [Sinosporangium album]SDI45126.1 DNA-binding transcriptional regulator, LysR family [Sinosporangium album]